MSKVILGAWHFWVCPLLSEFLKRNVTRTSAPGHPIPFSRVCLHRASCSTIVGVEKVVTSALPRPSVSSTGRCEKPSPL